MNLSSDETRALAFVALVVALAAAARVVGGPERLEGTAQPLEPAALAAASDSVRRADARRARPLAPGERLNPNTAPAEELERLPRVSRTLAARIVAERQRGGGFRGAADLVRVRGIGPRTVERLAPFLDFGPASRMPWRQREAPLLPGSILLEQGPDRARRGTGDAVAGAPLDLNRASAAELERLPGIGPALASRILAYRDSAGGFRSVDELERVRGIGPVLLSRLRPLVAARP